MTLYPIDIHVSQKESLIETLLFCINEKSERVTISDTSYKNYFYLKATIDDDVLVILQKYDAQIVGEQTWDYFGDDVLVHRIELTKTYVPKELLQELLQKEVVKDIFEADLPITRKYLMERQVVFFKEHDLIDDYILKKKEDAKTITYDRLTVCAFDIETYAKTKKINTKENPILSIGTYTKNEQIVFTWSNHESKHNYVRQYESEEKMLEAFFEYLKQTQPHIITGYNSDNFDWAYIADRCEFLKVRMNFSLIGDGVTFSGGTQRYAYVKGMPHVDLIHFIRTNMRTQLQTNSYSLDNVSKELLGDNKIPIDISKLYLAWDNKDETQLDLYLEYNVHDSKLCYDLLETLFLNITEFMNMIPVPIQDISRMAYSQLVEWFLIFRSREFHTLVPNKARGEELERRLREPKNEGAFVYKPTPGIYQNIAVFDFQSLYPSIISSLQLERATMNRDTKKEHRVPEMENELYFTPSQKAFIPTIIGDIIKRRVQIKQELKNSKNEHEQNLLKARIYNLKILANSMYGYLAFVHARWHSNESAAATTAYARHYIKYTIAQARKKGFSILYGDTDSIFLELKQKTKKDAQDFVAELNKTLPGIMELQLEDYFMTGIFVGSKSGTGGAKKRYALWDGGEKFKITGLEYVRSDWTDYARETQYELIKILLTTQDAQKGVSFVKEQIAQLESSNVPIEKLVTHAKLSRSLEEYETNLPHVVLGKKLKQLGEDVQKGTKIDYVVLEGSGHLYERVCLVKDADVNQLDIDYYVQNQILPVSLSLLAVFHISKEDILAKGTQNSLDSFFT